MLVSIEECEKLLSDQKYQEAKLMAVELLCKNPECEQTFLLLFHSSLAVGDDRISSVALAQMRILGVTTIARENELLKLFLDTRYRMKKLYSIGKYNESLEAAKIALQVAPSSIEPLIFKAKCFLRLDMPILAKGIIEKLMMENDDCGNLIFLHGIVKFYLGKLEEGLEFIKQAVEMDPDERKYLEMEMKIEKFLEPVHEARKQCANQQYESALAIYTKQIESPNVHFSWCFELLIMRARTYQKASNFDLAIIDINRALALPEAYNADDTEFALRAECHFAKEDYNSCISDCQAALERNSKNDTAKLLMKKAIQKKTLDQIIKKIDKGELKEAYEISYQNFQETRNEEFFIFAIQCARELNDKKSIVMLLESIKEDPELLDVVKISMGQFEEEIMTQPGEFTEALACFEEGNFGRCIELLKAAKKDGISMEKFPQLTFEKAQKILSLILNG